MSGIGDDIQQEFLAEAHELVETVSRDLLLLSEGATQGRLDPGLLNEVFRCVHTLKGIAGMFGHAHVGSIAHVLEDLLDDLRLGRLEFTQQVLDVLFDGVEQFQRLLQLEDPSAPSEEKTVAAFVAKIHKLAPANAAPPSDPLDAFLIEDSVLSVLTEFEENRLRACIRQGLRLFQLRTRFDLMSMDQSIDELKNVAQPEAEIITYLPSADGSDGDILELEILVASDLDIAAMREKFFERYGQVKPIEKRGQGAASAPAPVRLTTGIPPLAKRTSLPPRTTDGVAQLIFEDTAASTAVIANSVRVDINKLDHLMSVVGELGLVRSAVGRMMDRLHADASDRQATAELQRITRGFDRQLGELQAGILDVRMVPLGQVFNKLARTARQAAREHGKEVRFVVTGADTEVDKLIVEELADPLMHLVRNAIDHGIEEPGVRERFEKNRVGTLALNAYQKGSKVVIEVEDDGAGINPQALRETAINKGLLTQEAGATTPDTELLDLIFVPGFSTKGTITDLSGRGVGMDVVKTNIARLGGIIGIESEGGTGTKITITLPITLAIIRALIVKVAQHTYALPVTAVKEVLPYDASMVKTIQGRPVVSLRGETLRVSSLADLLKIEDPTSSRYVIVVAMANRRSGFIVDALEGQRDVIIKALGKSLSSVRGFAGAADLGDQSVALVLDAPALLEEALGAGEVRSVLEFRA